MFKRILLPLDGSPTAEKVLPVVIAEARCHGAVIIVLRVIAPLRSSLMMIPSVVETSNEHINRIAQEYLDDIAQRLRDEGVEAETAIDHGPPAERIVTSAEDLECDLIIIGSRGETGALSWRFGGTSNKVVKARTTIPVMVVTTLP